MARQKRGAGILQLQELSHALLGHWVRHTSFLFPNSHGDGSYVNTPLFQRCQRQMHKCCRFHHVTFPFEIPFTHQRMWCCIPACQASLWPKWSTWKWAMEDSKWIRKSKENALDGQWWPCQYHLAVSLPQGHPRGWPWLMWCCNNHREMFC